MSNAATETSTLAEAQASYQDARAELDRAYRTFERRTAAELGDYPAGEDDQVLDAYEDAETKIRVELGISELTGIVNAAEDRLIDLALAHARQLGLGAQEAEELRRGRVRLKVRRRLVELALQL